jgi:alcohol dehydrogenase class IV
LSAFPEYYQFAHPTRVIAGRGLIESLGFEFAKDGAKRPLIVTDEGLRATGLVEKAEAGIAGGGLTVGGGSVMDTAKVTAAVFSHGGEVLDYEGIYQLPREDEGMGAPLPTAPIACIPTTAGTGSEVSFAAVIKDPAQSFKVLFGDFPLFPRLAILDPESTATLPPHIAAATGMDAMTHAIEGYTTSERSPHGDAFALNALRIMRDNLSVAVEDPSNEDARGNMLIAACQAIVPGAGGTAALGAVHSMSHPAGAQFGVPHGVANAINLPHVIRFNVAGGPEIADRYRDLATLLGAESGGSDEAIGESLASWVTDLTSRMGLPQKLSEVGVTESGIPDLVEGAMGDGCTLTNARDLEPEHFEELYKQAI